jgi:hypothetical protein
MQKEFMNKNLNHFYQSEHIPDPTGLFGWLFTDGGGTTGGIGLMATDGAGA